MKTENFLKSTNPQHKTVPAKPLFFYNQAIDTKYPPQFIPNLRQRTCRAHKVDPPLPTWYPS